MIIWLFWGPETTPGSGRGCARPGGGCYLPPRPSLLSDLRRLWAGADWRTHARMHAHLLASAWSTTPRMLTNRVIAFALLPDFSVNIYFSFLCFCYFCFWTLAENLELVYVLWGEEFSSGLWEWRIDLEQGCNHGGGRGSLRDTRVWEHAQGFSGSQVRQLADCSQGVFRWVVVSGDPSGLVFAL